LISNSENDSYDKFIFFDIDNLEINTVSKKLDLTEFEFIDLIKNIKNNIFDIIIYKNSKKITENQ
jgi:hypothetical protein